MRIGVDLLAIQAASCRGRGIGRYAKSLLRALLVESADWEFVFYRRDDLAIDWDDDLDHRISEWVTVGPDPRDDPDGTLQQMVQRNPHRLDWLLVPNPLVERRGFALPEPVPGGPRLAAVVHDLIPALFPTHYLDESGLAAEYQRDLCRLRAYDLLLANSEATGRDVHRHLGVPVQRIANIRAAADPAFFRPAATEDEVRADAQALAVHGVREPFLYYLGNVDWRKNVLGLVDAYVLLPERVRTSYPLVLTFGENAWFRAVLAERIAEHGLGDCVIATGPASDEAVRAFCRRATLFLSPSRYEGFGLPTLEAMQSGAAVVAADNSSQPEVVGTAGALVPTDAGLAWAETIAGLVNDPERLGVMRRASLVQAAGFSWDDSARRLRTALASVAPRPMRPPGDRLAVVVYPSPRGSMFDAEIAALIDALAAENRVSIFLDTDRATTLPPLPLRAGWHEARLLGRTLPVLGDPPVLHLVDRLESLGPVLDGLRSHPGLVGFASRRTGSLADVSPAGDGTDGFRQILLRATGVSCHSEGLFRALSALIEEPRTAPLRLVPTTDAREAAGIYAALVRSSRTRVEAPPCPA